MDRWGPAGDRIYLGATAGGSRLARPEDAVLVLGPPRSGKTSSLVVPNVAIGRGAVVSTSTKTDVLEATLDARRAMGTCWLFDPTGKLAPPPGVERLRWSPLAEADDWEAALRVARVTVGAARPDDRDPHWKERAESVLAVLLHAAARAGGSMSDVVSWINRRDERPALAQLAVDGSPLAAEHLAGVMASEPRELSGVWSTVSSIVSCYRSAASLESASPANFAPVRFAASTDTVYICAAGIDQATVAPVISALVSTIVNARYEANRGDRSLPPMLLALDEVANIAPLPELPSIVAEGGGQGVLMLACLQDLSQARRRWGPQADGFLTLFGGKVLLPGVSDPATLRAVSEMCGEVEARSPSGGWAGGRMSLGWSGRPRRRLPSDRIREGKPGAALVIEGASPPGWVRLTPAHADRGWRGRMEELARGHERDRSPLPSGRGRPAR